MAKEQKDLKRLVIAARKGDTAALEQLLEGCSQNIYYVAFKMFKNKETAEDMTQEALTAIWKRLDSLKDPEAFYGWADRVAANLCLDHLRKKGVPVDAAAGEPEIYEAIPEPNEELLPQNALDQGETQRMVSQIIDNLPEVQRICVLLYYFRGMSVGDIARLIHCSEGTIKSRLSAARTKIRAGVLSLEEKSGIRLHALPLFPFFFGDSASLWVPGLARKVLPASLDPSGGSHSLLSALKAKLGALSSGAKIGAAVAAAAVAGAGAFALAPAQPQAWPLYQGVRYSEALVASAPSTQELYLYGPKGLVSPAQVKDLSFEVLDATPGASVELADSAGQEGAAVPWLTFSFDGSRPDAWVRLQMEVGQEEYQLEFHQVAPGALPDVLYAQSPFLAQPGQIIRPEDILAQLPDGVEPGQMSATAREGGPEGAGDLTARKDGSLQIPQTAGGQAYILHWSASDGQNLSYEGQLPVVVSQDGTSAEPTAPSGETSAGEKYFFSEAEYYIEQPPAPGYSRSLPVPDVQRVQLTVNRTDLEPMTDEAFEAEFSRDLGLSVERDLASSSYCLWLYVPESVSLGDTRLTLTLEGEVHELNIHIVEHGKLPGISYTADPLTLQAGDPLDVSTLFSSAPPDMYAFWAFLQGCILYPDTSAFDGGARWGECIGSDAPPAEGDPQPVLEYYFLTSSSVKLVGYLPVTVVS